MPITEFLEKNARLYPDEVALVEVNPAHNPNPEQWKELNLVELDPGNPYRREITWQDFECRANRFANLLMTREIYFCTSTGME